MIVKVQVSRVDPYRQQDNIEVKHALKYRHFSA